MPKAGKKNRSAAALAAWQRKAGPHAPTRRPYKTSSEALDEWDDACYNVGMADAKKIGRGFDVHDRVRVLTANPEYERVGRVVARTPSKMGYRFRVEFDEGDCIETFADQLERVL